MEIAIGIAVGLALVGCAIWVGLRQMEASPNVTYKDQGKYDPQTGSSNGSMNPPELDGGD